MSEEPIELRAMVDAFTTDEDVKKRVTKANRILSILDTNNINSETSSCLEIGTGSGVMSDVFKKRFIEFLSVDVNDIRRKEYQNFNFLLYDGRKIPAFNGQFNIIICTQVYQYVKNKNEFLKEMARVLKPGGKVYFTTSNKFAFVEPHFQLPLLGYCSKGLANFYMKITGKGNVFSIRSDSYLIFKRRSSEYFSIDDITIDMIKNYQNYDFSDIKSIRYISFLPRSLLTIIEKCIFPTWSFILTKKS